MPRQRTPRQQARDELFQSTLPIFRRGSGGIEGMISLTCMRRDCGGSIYVMEEEIAAGKPTAPCFHCFRASRLPKRDQFSLSDPLV